MSLVCFEFREILYSKSRTFLPFLAAFCSDVDTKPYVRCPHRFIERLEFYKNWLSESHNLIRSVN